MGFGRFRPRGRNLLGSAGNLPGMNDRVVPDRFVPGAFAVRFGGVSQSWVDPDRPDFLAFEYIQHIAMTLDHTVLAPPDPERLRIVHIGGAAMSLPRWVAWRRPGTAQVVLEPDVELTQEVRRKVPLPAKSGIKVRDVDGLSGILAMPDEYADAIVLDAFAGSQVPGELVSVEALRQMRRIGRGQAVIICNVTDKAPFNWAKKVVAGVRSNWRHSMVGAESPVLRGKRFGNLLIVGSASRLFVSQNRRESAKLPYGYRWLDESQLRGWVGGAVPFTADDATPSPEPSGSKVWFA